ncbi:MAG: sucrose-6-phosphate hydrolase [Vibrionaceae bacterium]
MIRAASVEGVLHAVMQGQPKALADAHYPQWHLAPVTGLMNDPNGFISFDGRYHLFYQWNPFACDHTYKCWGHWSSADLLQWRHEPIALMPTEEYDRNGCYSGCAVDNGGALTLCYTGNVKFADGGRTAWQCLAVQNAAGGFDKSGPVLALPQGYTGHVRDPKVWQHDGVWYMVLGAQDLQKKGKVLLYSSPNLKAWDFISEIAGNGINGLDDAGYMWECPDLFAIDGTFVLICCPQGLARESERFLNTYPSTWLSGKFDHATGKFEHGALVELDAGFEFYAPQTQLAPDGRRLLVAWMGVPEGEELLQPTLACGWVHQMTCVRELAFVDGKLYQKPARELQNLREQRSCWNGTADEAPAIAAQRLELSIIPCGALEVDFSGALTLQLSEKGIRLARKSLVNDEIHYRYWNGSVKSLRIFCDSSSVEVFINDGEGVMSSRYFPQHPAAITFTGSDEVALEYWPLHACMVE